MGDPAVNVAHTAILLQMTVCVPFWGPCFSIAGKGDMPSCQHADAMPDALSMVQLVDFLTPRINKAGGMMPLPDVYCLFNRARGTELMSPDDLLTAVKLLPSIGAQLAFRQFASGVLIVQSPAHSDEQVEAMQRQCACPCLSCPC